MMASKRQLDYMDTLAYTKVPRVEKESENVMSMNVYKPDLLTSYFKEDPLKYSGTYLTYPLNHLNSDGLQLSSEWNPFASHLQPSHNPVSQHVRKGQHPNSSFLYTCDTLTPNQDFHHSVPEKNLSSSVTNAKNVAGNWGNFERQGLLKQNKLSSDLLPSGPTLKPGIANPILPLQTSNNHKIAVPKPLYGNCICSESGCNSKSCLSPSNQMEHHSARSQKATWSSPPSVTARPVFVNGSQQSFNQHCGTSPSLAKNIPYNQSLQHSHGAVLHPKDSGRGTLAFRSLPYDKFTALQMPPQEQGCSQLHSGSPKSIPSLHTSPSTLVEQHKLPVHPVAVSSQMMPPKPLCQEKMPASIHVMPSHMYPCPAGNPLPSKECSNFSPVQSAGSHKEFSFPLKDNPQLAAYCEQERSKKHLTKSSVSCMYQTSLPLSSNASTQVSVVETGLQKKDSIPPNQPGCKFDLLQQNPGYTFSAPEFPAYRPLILYDTHSKLSVDCSVPKVQGVSPTKIGGSTVQLSSSHSAFQPVYSEKNMNTVSDKQMNVLREDLDPRSRVCREACTRSEMHTLSEMECRKVKSQGLYVPEVGKRFLSLEESHSKTRPKELSSCVPIVISDSPEKMQIDCEKRAEMKQTLLVSNCLVPPSRGEFLPIDGKSVPLHHLDEQRSYSPPSPPMPVINNVFSLAPYRTYLEKSYLASPLSQTQQKVDRECSALVARGSVEKQKTECIVDRERCLTLPKDSNTQTQETFCSKDCHSSGSKRLKELCQEESRMAAAQDMKNERKDTGEKLQALNYSLKDAKSNVFHEGCNVSSKTSSGNITQSDQDSILDLSFKKTVHETVKNIVDVKECCNQEGNVMKKQTESSNTSSDNKVEKPEKVDCLKEVHQSLPFVSSADRTNFQSSASFLFKKFKILKSAVGKVAETLPGPQLQKPTEDQNVELSAQDKSQALKLTGKLLLPEVAQDTSQGLKLTGTLVLPSIAASVPLSPAVTNSSTALSETSVVLPNGHTSEHKASSRYFLHLHQTLCSMVSNSVLHTSADVLQDWVQKMEVETNKTKAQSKSLKHKNGTRVLETVDTSTRKDVWLYGNVQSLLKNVLSQLDSYMLLKNCPFPHVIRAGTIFIPIYVVKQKLFPTLPGILIDQVLQDYKVELRPTTLSEEKQLTDLQLKGCSSKLKKLLSLKQLPVIYPDLLNLYWCECARNHLALPRELEVTNNIAEYVL